MKDQNKTSAQLLSELAELRQRVAELETAKVERKTCQAKSEEALRESEEKYRILLDESSDPVFSFNPEGQYRYVNKAFADGVGKKREEITGKKIWDVFPKDEADKRYAAVKWVFENGETKVIEVRVPRPDGDLYYITTVKPILNDQGKVISVICISKEITERKRAEESLRLQSAALEAAANGIVITEQAGTILWANPAFTALTGYTAKEAIGQNPRILKSGLHAPAFYQILWQTIQSGQVWHAEVMNRRKDGSLYVEEMTITPVRSTGGEITHFVAIKQDVTERKWTENKLQETKDQLEAILQGIADGINVSDAAGQLVYVNDAAARAAGYPSAQAMLQDCGPGRLFESFDILDESGRPFPIAQLPDRLALQEKQAQSATLCYRGKATGQEKWSVVQATPILDESGQVRFVVAITHDITERRRMEEAEREQRVLAQALRDTAAALNSTLEFDLVLDHILANVGRVVPHDAANIMLIDERGDARIARARGYAEQTLGKVLSLHMPVASTPNFRRMAETAQPVFMSDTHADPAWIKTKEFMWVRSYAGMPIRLKGKVIGILNLESATPGFFTPAHTDHLRAFADQAAIAIENARLYNEARRYAEELEQQARDLQARNEELDAFAHTVAHDLKNPLGLIMGHADLLAQENATLSDDQQRSFQAIYRNGRKMNSIIEELLLLAEVRQVQVGAAPLNMASIVSEAQQRLADLVGQYHAEILVPDASAWPVAVGYAPWVEEVWVNYFSNALKYGGRPPRLELGADPLPNPPPYPDGHLRQAGEGKGGGMVRFWVRDNGAGLTPEDQARLFTPFTRLDQVQVKGHGLGLSIVRRIVEKLGGQVGVESQVGQGSVFSFTLPGCPRVLEYPLNNPG